MTIITAEKLANIPCLIVSKQHKNTHPLPTILYFHGYTSAKEHNLPIAYLLAEKGFRVVLPDALYHGERDGNLSKTELQISFWDIVLQNIRDVGQIKEALNRRELILDERIGLAGTSMGGITTASALTKYAWIKTAAILMGTPKISAYAEKLVDLYKDQLTITEEKLDQLFSALFKYDLSKQIEKLNNRPLLFWHGEKDEIIPFEQAYAFYLEADKQYENKEAIRFIGEPNRKHKVSRLAILETVKWFQTHL